jgi:RNA polymerase sigma factor (sigma-70 family)
VQVYDAGMDEDDMALLDRWCGGDKSASDALLARHFDSIYRFFEHKVDGEVDDLVQETFLACVSGRGSFRRESSFRTYLFAIARNTLYRHWSKRAPPGRDEDITTMSLASLSTSIGGRLARRQEEARLLAALRQLPLDQQLLLELHYWEDLDAEQLAAVFDTAPATSRSRLFRARAALRTLLTVEDATPEVGTAVDARSARLLGVLAKPEPPDSGGDRAER